MEPSPQENDPRSEDRPMEYPKGSQFYGWQTWPLLIYGLLKLGFMVNDLKNGPQEDEDVTALYIDGPKPLLFCCPPGPSAIRP